MQVDSFLCLISETLQSSKFVNIDQQLTVTAIIHFVHHSSTNYLIYPLDLRLFIDDRLID
jgi:hypothetical protein